MTESSRRRRAPALRMGLLVVAVLVAVAGGQSNSEHSEGGPPGGVPVGGGQGGPPQGGGGPPHGDGGHGGGPPHGGGGEAGGEGGGPHEGGEGNHHGMMSGHHGGADGMMGGRDGLHEGHHPGGEGSTEEFERPPVCSAEQAQAALEASSDYVSCSGLEYKHFMSLVHADFDLLEQASACFATSVKEMEHKEPNEQGKIVVEVDKVFKACVEQVEAADETRSTEATTDFLKNIIGSDSKICSCLPAYVDKMPLCDLWARYHHLGMRIEELCDHVGEAEMPTPGQDGEAGQGTQQAGQETEEAAVTEIQDVDPNEVIDVKDSSQDPPFPNTYGPCPPGQEVHPTDATQCQPMQNSQDSEGGYGGPQGSEGGGPPSKGGGIFGFGMSVVVVGAVGSLMGFGAVWVWGKYQSGTRQPGVRYMATGAVDNDIGTELGPFGREYP